MKHMVCQKKKSVWSCDLSVIPGKYDHIIVRSAQVLELFVFDKQQATENFDHGISYVG